MAKLPFSIFRRTGRRYYYVQFKNEKTGGYMTAISTRQETEAGAVSIAFQWLKEGIPQKSEQIPLEKYSLRDMARETDLSSADCEFICKELQRRGMLKSYVVSESKQAIDFTEYLRGFWNYDHSQYVQEKLRKRHSIHRRYVIGQAQDSEKYWIPFFSSKVLGEIT